ncbi:TerC/Alx family metal homeostasis membrane protein [Mycobacterium talmoniae]|uniref:Putative membrane protein n=1 Tax=Mycobacterium talmoniae TaxID=1858794 RepID=A0A1S1NGM4_9MYCO|nr:MULTISPECIES: TerC/Alx family metal homeostasis membrane protein [Mycobacterium]OHV03562.1 tellurium resistance protein TerC [Mycobacterium talmoniae]PQM44364.1 putative membrane protein [Mycobacterium talmoniae]TDH56351.1 TerC/Alx family metal homeostasis membrane protein [Mycobacterium eburneum]
MHLSLVEWTVTLAVTVSVLLFDVLVIARRPREPSVRECAIALSGYVLLAALFGIWIWFGHGARFGMQFFAGWLTEYSLSIDNLFVFVLVMASFNVPKRYQQEVLFVGIVLALVFRGVFITLGAVAIQKVSWTFYLFGAFIIWAAFRLVLGGAQDSDGDNTVVRFARTYLNTTDKWDGLKLYIKNGTKRAMTPMFFVVLALATTDLMFALDSIPAIFGLTRQPYLVFTANVLALMGLRQLYFLLGGMLTRLVYLSRGLAVILLFIGVKMILQALNQNELPFLNGGRPFDVPKISTALSLLVIVAILLVTTVASLYKTSGTNSRKSP